MEPRAVLNELLDDIEYHNANIEVSYSKGNIRLYSIEYDVSMSGTVQEMTKFINEVAKAEKYEKDLYERWSKGEDN